MAMETHEDGEDLPLEIIQIKEQIEKERFKHIKETFEHRCKQRVYAHAFHHQLLALTRPDAKYNNGRDNNTTLLSRMEQPLRHFIGSSDYVSNNKEGHYVYDREFKLQSVKLPFLEQLPRSVTWVFTNRSHLMAESDSVFGKRQIYYLDGEAVELSSEEEDEEDEAEDEEEPIKEKREFSKGVDRFIWMVGQDYGLDDQVVLRALAKYFEVDASDILERYNELKLNNDEDVGETSDLSSKETIDLFQEAAYRRHCRRCLIFDCHTHELYQPVIKSGESSKSNLSMNEDDNEQCSEHCYLTETAYHVVIDTNEVTTDIREMTTWTPPEKDLYMKGLEIFGRNSCLIGTNVLRGYKTCRDIYNYMTEQDQSILLLEHNKTNKHHLQVHRKVYRKNTKFVRKKIRRRTYARCPPALKKTANGEVKYYKHYTPCTCESTCGDQCPCLTNENCCEKFCGCSKNCNNRFGGCNCGIGQCVNRQCPCVAASRECDPDICRKCFACWGHEETEQTQPCKNMQFLLNKNKKLLIGRSDVQGWGAFTLHSIKKNEYLGEYTGELISHAEAEERGRVEDRTGYSYLFTLNDQLEIDARRIGNKLKFLNHSSKPNCYAKLMIVRGDQRIGIFAEKAIEEGEELFFDYCYGPDHAGWSRGQNTKNTGASKKSKEVVPSSEEKSDSGSRL
ncbi:histone-lysine N-methyltransferase MEDEA [Capsella rubella]|uniref:histone-lysine N-methyltransferase MEDEA n=1 Tax=Capsella rubella TaxID=81985 RepID=UPI000CD59B77|nr:histone-lysine N-methyltransferase MEDEA [Capsella rubella]